jgi:hypothetical protein
LNDDFLGCPFEADDPPPIDSEKGFVDELLDRSSRGGCEEDIVFALGFSHDN